MRSQITEKRFESSYITDIKKIVNYIKGPSEACLQFPKLDRNSLRLVVFAGVSFDNLSGNRSQLGFAIVLADHNNL